MWAGVIVPVGNIAFDVESDLEESGAELLNTNEFKRSQTDKFMALRPLPIKQRVSKKSWILHLVRQRIHKIFGRRC